MRDLADVSDFILARPGMLSALEAVASLALPDGWIGAGFIRNAVWDALHRSKEAPPLDDVDVVFFDRAHPDAERHRTIETQLRRAWPQICWSVKNQARMHARNGDAPYQNMLDAVTHWPETATAVAARWRDGRVEMMAPHGVGDLLGLIVRPTPAFAGRPEIVRRRMREKRWLLRWPRLTVVGM
jgi:hypothetical protein